MFDRVKQCSRVKDPMWIKNMEMNICIVGIWAVSISQKIIITIICIGKSLSPFVRYSKTLSFHAFSPAFAVPLLHLPLFSVCLYFSSVPSTPCLHFLFTAKNLNSTSIRTRSDGRYIQTV